MLTRLLVCGMLAVTANLAQAQATSRLVVEINMLADGSMQVDGHRYVTQSAKNAEIARLNRRKPFPEIHIHIDRLASYDSVAQLLAKLQRGGHFKIGIVNTQQ
jgi:biopolymer transport protein ExbD